MDAEWFLRNSEPLRNNAMEALASHFQDRDSLESFIQQLDEQGQRTFLQAASWYLYFVKKGEWRIGDNPHTTYLTNTYKLVGLFGVIEFLGRPHEFVEFKVWLCRTKPFPDLSDPRKLEAQFQSYKAFNGAKRFCDSFFGLLDRGEQDRLCLAVEVGGRPLKSISKFSGFLYDLRSKFVHQAQVVLDFEPMFTLCKSANSCRVTIEDVTRAFEICLVRYFKRDTNGQSAWSRRQALGAAQPSADEANDTCTV